MKKLILLTAIFAGLFLSGCANSSSGSDDDTPVPEKITYDILGTWYYSHIYGNLLFGEENKAVFSKSGWNFGYDFPQNKNVPDDDRYEVAIYNKSGEEEGRYRIAYNKDLRTFYTLANSEYEGYESICKYSISFTDQKFSISQETSGWVYCVFGNKGSISFSRYPSSTEDPNHDLNQGSGSNSDGGSGTGGSSGSGGDEITLSGSYDAAERSGVSLRFNKEEGTWAQWYDGIRRKNGTYSQSGSTLTVNWYSDTQYRNYSADFTVSSENGNIILTASSGDTVTVIGQGFGLSASLSTGKVTLSK